MGCAFFHHSQEGHDNPILNGLPWAEQDVEEKTLAHPFNSGHHAEHDQLSLGNHSGSEHGILRYEIESQIERFMCDQLTLGTVLLQHVTNGITRGN